MLLALATSGCVSWDHDGRFSRHAELSNWKDGFTAQLEEPSQWGTEAALLAAVPVLRHYDHDLQDHLASNATITGGNSSHGDSVAVVLGATAIGFGGLEMLQGDQARMLEVSAESLLVTEGITDLLKVTVRRPRPEGSSNESFPSDHASISFAAATLLARGIDEGGDEWWRKLGYLAYAPATYVAIDRVEANRHFPSDVVAGAFLGVLTTNWIFDAHYGDSTRRRRGIFGDDAVRSSHLSWSLDPWLGSEGVGAVFSLRF